MRIALVILALALAGCASSPAPEQTRAPVVTPTQTPPVANASAAPDEVVLLSDTSYVNETRNVTVPFTVAKGHWLCFVTNVTTSDGVAVVSVETPNDGPWTALATSASNNTDVMVPWTGDAPFVVHLNLTAFTGRIALNVTNEA